MSENRKSVASHVTIGEKVLELYEGESVFAMLQRQEMTVLSFCGGKGICGRCRIRFCKNAPLPTNTERKLFTPEELRSGIRLACLAKPKGDCSVTPEFQESRKCEVVTAYDMAFAPKERHTTLLAVDLGTTTLAAQLIDGKSKAVLGTYHALNPQRSFGADVISRMEASNQGQKQTLQRLIREALKKAITSLTKETDIPVFLAGNTVMMHLLMGYSTETLSRHPFTPVSLREREIMLAGHKVFLLPGISAFVGADIMAGVLALSLQKSEGYQLFVDLGTNGEIVLGNKEGLICTATAAGPAFEGGITAQLRGTDMIAIAADLLETGVIDETGLLHPIQETVLTQKDIRALQMAKAAVYAGIQVLVNDCGISEKEIETVFLAGGFGYYLDANQAGRIGLFPASLEKKVKAVGNTALLGAYRYGADPELCRKEAGEILTLTTCINLAEQKNFEELYIAALNFPKYSAYIE